MLFQQIRSATSVVTFNGKSFLIDPMLAPANTYPIIPDSPVCGKGNPTIHTIQKISEQLGAPPEKLFENSDDFTSLFSQHNSDLDLLSCLSEEDCALFDDFLNQLIHLILKNE